jgi:hypothetical protein
MPHARMPTASAPLPPDPPEAVPAPASGPAAEVVGPPEPPAEGVRPPEPPVEGVPPPEPPPPEPPPAAGADHRDRFGLAIPILLAALGLAAALIAWRGGVAASTAEDANRAGLDAARAQAASAVTNEGLVARTLEAYLDYERSRRRAEALDAAGFHDRALLERKLASSHWFLVQPDYLDQGGQLQVDRQRAALMADDATDTDMDPAPHFAVADAEYARLGTLIVAGVLVAFALPFLTMAEFTSGRLRVGGMLAGIAVFALGLGVGALAWL